MMEEVGRHAPFIWSAYGVTGAVALGLVLRAVLEWRRQSRLLGELEGGGRLTEAQEGRND